MTKQQLENKAYAQARQLPPFYLNAPYNDLIALIEQMGYAGTVKYDRENECLAAVIDGTEINIYPNDKPEIYVQEEICDELNQTFRYQAFDAWEGGQEHEVEFVHGKRWETVFGAVADKLAKWKVAHAFNSINPTSRELPE